MCWKIYVQLIQVEWCIYVSFYVNIGSDNGLLPERRQSII